MVKISIRANFQENTALTATRKVKKFICANPQIKTTALTAAANPAQVAETPGLHDPSALPHLTKR